jgi:hypothetical protein
MPEELQIWYRDQCDGEWEHRYGVVIETLDNPGWLLKIDLAGTRLESKSFAPIEANTREASWVHCKVQEQKFEAACGPTMFSTAIGHFLSWANDPDRPSR